MLARITNFKYTVYILKHIQEWEGWNFQTKIIFP